jgi:KDO2-lipid IV(A) lauroyltransferase
MKLIPAQLGAAVHIHNALANGSSIGMLVDQHFAGWSGCPLLRPAVQGQSHAGSAGAQISIRLPDGRLRLEVTEALKVPRDADGKIDVAATMQLITWVIEGWVRENPEQWLWLHRRWR